MQFNFWALSLVSYYHPLHQAVVTANKEQSQDCKGNFMKLPENENYVTSGFPGLKLILYKCTFSLSNFNNDNAY